MSDTADLPTIEFSASIITPDAVLIEVTITADPERKNVGDLAEVAQMAASRALAILNTTSLRSTEMSHA